MSSDLYVKHMVANVECELSNTDQALETHVSTPVAPGYLPEVDAILELYAQRGAYFQGLIGLL